MKRPCVAFVVLAVSATGCRDVPRTLGPSVTDVNQATSTSLSPVIYSNFGPGGAYDANPFHGYTINGFLGPTVGQQAIAQQFVPTSSYALQEVTIPVTSFQGNDSLRLAIQKDSGGGPGPVLEVIPVGGFAGMTTLVTGRSRTFPVLRQGSAYWLTVLAGGNGVVAGWNWNSIGDVATGTFAVTQGGGTSGPWSVGSASTRSAFRLSGTSPAQGLKPFTIDDVTFYGPTSLVIGGAGLLFDATISNRTETPRTQVALQVWVEQGTARRAGGGQLVSCEGVVGSLAPGTCVRVRGSVAASNTTAGRGTLVPGPALAVISLVQVTTSGQLTLASKVVPVTLANQQGVLSVAIVPSDTVLDQVGIQAQLAANVQAVGGASTQVLWTSSNASVAVVNATTGRVVAVSPGAALITATSTFDATKSGTSLVSVQVQPSFGNGVNVSPGQMDLLPNRVVTLAAQVVGGPSGAMAVYWASSQTSVATVSSTGQVTAVWPGTAKIIVTSKADLTKVDTVYVRVHAMQPSAPASPVNISTGFTNPPANPTSVSISAFVSAPSGSALPFSRVDFAAMNGGVPSVFATASPMILDNGITRTFLWTATWTPGTAFGTGPQTIVAIAYNALGRVGTVTINTNITLTDP